MCSKSQKSVILTKKPKPKNHRKITVGSLKLRYKFIILMSVLILAGISIVLRIEAPVVWTFLYGIGGWAALTNNPVLKN